eukprot:12665018-Alexandrium_andersonii.AAC.1
MDEKREREEAAAESRASAASEERGATEAQSWPVVEVAPGHAVQQWSSTLSLAWQLCWRPI